MGTFEWASGETITASKLQDMLPIMVTKVNATSRTSTTATADPDLVITLRANVTYHIKMSCSAIGDAAGDIKISYSVTGTLTESPLVRRVFHGMSTAGSDPATSASTRTDGANTASITTEQNYGVHATSRNNIWEEFVIAGGASGGTLSLVWGLVSATGTTQITKGFIKATPVNLL